jgi:hypothetical protein
MYHQNTPMYHPMYHHVPYKGSHVPSHVPPCTISCTMYHTPMYRQEHPIWIQKLNILSEFLRIRMEKIFLTQSESEFGFLILPSIRIQIRPEFIFSKFFVPEFAILKIKKLPLYGEKGVRFNSLEF